MLHFMVCKNVNQSTTLYLQVILLAPQVQSLLEVLGSPRIERDVEKTEQFYQNCYYNNNKSSYLPQKLEVSLLIKCLILQNLVPKFCLENRYLFGCTTIIIKAT